MLTPRRLLGPLVALLVAAGGTLPGQALAQGAGDEQYQDPLAGEQEPPEAGNDESEPSQAGGGEPPSQTPAPEAPAPSGPDTSTSSGAGSGSVGAADPAPAGAEPAPAAPAQGEAAAPLPSAREAGRLPRTGGDPVLAGALGAALLAAGTGLRVRVRAADGPR